ncbi:GntR family transcriptional regulator [Roseomonas xinghualingensis]|uniref:GntR family transcriptional regulator n=1 Tax=Roseomonas xinghualingensis TaxID=2986475 RepID=UPI0021F1FE03|nr:GntR family transcriptional regulator [Roseomonas sp. SXEYE001]MCV4209793.1 GntR family transcriptional regulator [Roseomonas sp. SXEYE001]
MARPSRTGETDATRVRRLLRASLIEGEIPPGSKLRVQALATQYGTGASPVREALSSLAAEGLVERLDQRGFRAAPVTLGAFEELLRARCWVEELVLRESILAGGQQWEEALVVARYRLSRTPRRADPSSLRDDPAWDRVHLEFHRALTAACPSPTMLGFCETLRERASRYRGVALTVAYPTRDVAAEHEAIAEAALARQVPEACRLLVEHYQRTAGYLRLALEGSQSLTGC